MLWTSFFGNVNPVPPQETNYLRPLTKSESRDVVCKVRTEVRSCFCKGDLCPDPKTFRFKRRGFRPNFFDK